MISPIYDSAKLPLRLYSVNRGVYGMSVCVAYTSEQAAKILEQEYGYDPKYDHMESHDLVDGLCLVNRGDE